MTNQDHTSIEALFHPRSVAVVGLPRGMKTGKLFLLALLDLGFPGPIYPVNPFAREIDGLACFPDVAAIPGPVDLAICLVPSSRAMEAVEQCAQKGVKCAVLFTAGYAESGTSEGRELQEKMKQTALKAGMRLVGPNGMGFYCPDSGVSFFPGLSREPGPIAMFSHSGSLANILCRMGPEKGLYFSSVVSLGNECDLSAAELMDYWSQDPKTKVVGGYVEGIKNGREFFAALKKAAAKKPVVLWKMGQNQAGARAALSHTAALSGSKKIWQSVVRQTGAVAVSGWEAYMDALMGFTLVRKPAGPSMAVVSGPGGLAVSAAEAIGENNLKLARLTDATRGELRKLIPPTGTSAKNPIDLGLSSSLDINLYIQATRLALEDENTDAVLVSGIGLDDATNREYTEAMIRLSQDHAKPLVLVRIPGYPESFQRMLADSGVALFESPERAVAAYASMWRYYKNRRASVSAPC